MLHETGFLVPTQVTFLTTNTCTAACDHCSVHSSPTRKGKLTATQMIATIDQLIEVGEMRLIVFAGGEPTLLGKDLLDTIAYADSRGLMTRMVTNAHWATSNRSARAKLLELREAGLRELNISCDDYHTPFIPLQRIAWAWHASKDLGFDSVVIASASGPASELTPDRIRELLGEEIPDFYDSEGVGTSQLPIKDGSVRIISNANIARLGRGKTIPIHHLKVPKQQRELDVRCPWIGGSPAVSPENHLLSCCGMEANRKPHLDYGNLGGKHVRSLLADAEKDTMVAALHELGPFRIMKMLQRFEPTASFWTHYTGICELCEDIFGRPDIVQLLHKHRASFEIVIAAVQQRRQHHLQKSSA